MHLQTNKSSATTNTRVLSAAYQPPTPPPRVSLIQFPAHDTVHRISTVYSPEVVFTSNRGATDIRIRACDSHILIYSLLIYTATTYPHQDSMWLTITRSSQSLTASFSFPTQTPHLMRSYSTMTTCTPIYSASPHSRNTAYQAHTYTSTDLQVSEASRWVTRTVYSD